MLLVSFGAKYGPADISDGTTKKPSSIVHVLLDAVCSIVHTALACSNAFVLPPNKNSVTEKFAGMRICEYASICI